MKALLAIECATRLRILGMWVTLEFLKAIEARKKSARIGLMLQWLGSEGRSLGSAATSKVLWSARKCISFHLTTQAAKAAKCRVEASACKTEFTSEESSCIKMEWSEVEFFRNTPKVATFLAWEGLKVKSTKALGPEVIYCKGELAWRLVVDGASLLVNPSNGTSHSALINALVAKWTWNGDHFILWTENHCRISRYSTLKKIKIQNSSPDSSSIINFEWKKTGREDYQRHLF